MKSVWVERLVLVSAVLFAWYSWSAKQNAERDAIISSENYAAALDSVRHVQVGKDSAALVSLTQMAVHLKGALGKLAKEEGLNARLRADLAVATRGLDTVVVGVAAPLAGDSGRLVDSVVVTGPPISGVVTADLAPWRPTTWGLRLKPDPISLTVVVGCREGLPPSLIVTAPEWATVTPKGVLDPSICHPKAQKARWPWFLGGIGAGILMWEIAR